MVEYWYSGIVNGLLQQVGLRSSIIPTFRFSIALFFLPSILPTLLYSIFLLLLALSLSVGISAAAFGQTTPPSSVRCPSPANPGGLYFECVGQPIDYIEETLSKDWGGFRTKLNTLGITPTASYTTQLMGNPVGGQSQGFTYAGTLEASINWDLDRLLGIPGLSFNIGGAWSTGRNLSADHIGNKATVQSAYTAPGNGTNNLTLGEIYLQQQLFSNSLVIAAGRLAPQSTFATMPVFNNYINAGYQSSPGCSPHKRRDVCVLCSRRGMGCSSALQRHPGAASGSRRV